MDQAAVEGAVWGVAFAVLVVIVVLSRRARRHGGTFTAGVAGAMYGLQNRDKQRALDVIVEGKAAQTRPEYPDGNLPDLEQPRRGASAGKS